MFAQSDRVVELFNRLFLVYSGHLSCIANVRQDRHAAELLPSLPLYCRVDTPLQYTRLTAHNC